MDKTINNNKNGRGDNKTEVCWLGKKQRGAAKGQRGNSHHYITLAANCFFRSPVSVLIYLLGSTGKFHPLGQGGAEKGPFSL